MANKRVWLTCLWNYEEIIKKNILFILFVISFAINAHSTKLHNFVDLINPFMLTFDKKYVYISDQYSIHIYDRVDFMSVKKLLQKGEGPQEVINLPIIFVNEGVINIFAGNKIILYSKEFDFIKEIKASISETWKNVPIESNFVLCHFSEKDNVLHEIYTLFNYKLAKICDLTNITVNPLDEDKYLIIPRTTIASRKNKVFIAQPQKGFFIEIFNEQGGKIGIIEKKIAKIKPTEKHRERELEKFMIALGKSKYIKYNISQTFGKRPFMEYLPAIKNISIDENRIYIQTYEIRGDKDKYLVFDFKGNILYERWLPKVFVNKFTFFDNSFYFFQDSDEGWWLHKIDLN